MRHQLSRYTQKLSELVRHKVHGVLNKHSFFHIENFTRPYIVEKSVEGADFLFHIKDRHSRLWYDLYSTDPVWPEMRFIRDNLLRPGDVVIECGSHHGCTTIMLSKWVGTEGRVYAYEPGVRNYEILKENLALNNIENVSAINAVVGSCAGSVDFIEYADNSMGSRVAPSNGSAGRDGTIRNLKQVSLDVHMAERPALVKIDTQGYVYQPLLGLKDMIENQRPNLALEIDGEDAIKEYGDNFSKIFDLIKHDDYIYFVSFDSSEEPVQMKLSELITEWEKRNNFTKDIHLFAQNRKNQVLR